MFWVIIPARHTSMPVHTAGKEVGGEKQATFFGGRGAGPFSADESMRNCRPQPL